MKKILFFAAACVALVSCSSDGFIGDSLATTSNGEITFSQSTPNITRATGGEQAAAKLNNNFVVYGYKIAKTETEAADASKDTKVFDLYNVSYTKGSAYSSKSNTNDWEYVGLTSLTGANQSIKYWDFSAGKYVFSAVSATGATIRKITDAGELSSSSVLDKGWEITVPSGSVISDIYASNRIEKVKQEVAGVNTYGIVDFTFYSVMSKVRFGFYETVPGYSVKIDKCHFGGTSSTTNFGVDGTFKGGSSTGDTHYIITYYSDNKPKLSLPVDASTSKSLTCGTNLPGTTLGTSSNLATYDQAEGVYTAILPYQSMAASPAVENVLSMKIDYTLTSLDGSGEDIHVYNATAYIPTQYTQWKENYAYTYLFKISDNTSGTTGEDPKDPKGLYPVTFDACVTEAGTSVQETVTSVADPSITTYQSGEVVTINNEYKAGDIYYMSMKDGVAQDISSSKVYRVEYNGTTPLTEEFVANYANNDVNLIEIATTGKSTIPGTGVTLSDTKHIMLFNAVQGVTYAIKNGDGWKLVKVTGTPVAPTYTVGVAPATSTISTLGTAAKFSISAGTSAPVIGAVKSIKVLDGGSNDVTSSFVITEVGDGDYTVTYSPALLNAGANGTYTIDFAGQTDDFTIDLTYALSKTALTIVAGNTTGATTNLTINTTAHPGAKIENTNAGITVTDNGDGSYTVKAAATVAHSATPYTLTIAGLTVNVTVDTYALTPSLVLAKPYTGNATGTVVLTKNGDKDNAPTLVSSAPTKLTITNTSADGKYNIAVTNAGTYTVSYENALCDVTVNAYTLTAAAGSIAKTTGTKTLVLRRDGLECATASANFVADGTQPGTYTVNATGSYIVFGEASAAGDYRFNYKVGDVVVAKVTITVVE